MKRFFAIITVCLLCLCCTIPVFGAKSSDSPLVMDDSGVLSTDEYNDVLNALESASNATGSNICVAFVDQQQSYNIQDSADLYYEDHWGMDTDGILMYVDTAERDYIFSTSGDTIYCFTQTALNEMTDDISGNYLSKNDWAGAAKEYAYLAQRLIEYKAENGYAYGEKGSASDKGKSTVTSVVIAIIAGIIISLIITGNMKNKLKTVQAKASASDYFSANDFRLKAQKDTFLFTNVSKVPINRDSKGGSGFGGHISSSGGFHGGGGGGKF